MSNSSEEVLYNQVASEIEVNDIKKGTWAKAFAECAGNEQLTKAIYIKLRVQNLKNEEWERKKKTISHIIKNIILALLVAFLVLLFVGILVSPD